MRPTDYNFPFDEYRQVQLDALEWASQADRQVLMLSAPPGVGKSLIGATWGKMFGGSKGFILTKTLSLLQQYETQLGIPGVRGAANFNCEVLKKFNCEDGAAAGCPFRSKKPSTSCPYVLQKAEGLAAPQAVAAYAFALWNPVERDYLVCDEGHSLLDILTDYESISIPLDLNPPMELERLPAWATLTLPKVQASKPSADAPKAVVRWERTVRALERLKTLDNYPHVMVETSKSLVLKPVWPRNPRRLWGKAQALLMSATLFSGGLMADLLNLAPGNWDYLEVPSPFEVGRRPLYVKPVVKLNAKSGPAAYDALAETIAWLMKSYPGEKGLLHVSSYKQVQMLKYALEDLPDVAPLLVHQGQKGQARDKLFREFRQRPGPLWLLSPSAREGEDFPYDQARVNVLVKIPYPDLSDPVLAARREDGVIGKTYYSAVTCANLAQAYGRGMRAEDDFGATWVLDSNIYNLLRWNREHLPQYLLEAVQRV